MSVPVIAFFNNKGGVGKTSMVYHLAWMFADLRLRVIASDLDPQCNLTAAFLDEDRLEQVLPEDSGALTVFRAAQPLIGGTGDVVEPDIEIITPRLGLVIGDMGLSKFEDELSTVWPDCLERKERAFRVTSALWRIMQKAAEKHRADMILADLGPNLGAINRAALIASDYVVIPLGPDLFSLQGLQNLGPSLRGWREGWGERLERNPIKSMILPEGKIQPIGYMVLRHSIRLDRTVKAFDRWMAKIPSTYATAVLQNKADPATTVDNDSNCIAKLKDYRSLMPLAQEARKPMFFLKPADGALGAHQSAVQETYKDFETVAKKIAPRVGIKIPS